MALRVLRSLAFVAGLLTLLVAVADLPAQEDGSCRSGRVASIRIKPAPVFEENHGAGALSKVYAVGNWLHIETRESVIRRELLFEEGDCLEWLRLSESERLLRDLPFIESAKVEARRRRDGDYDVTVATRDEWSLRLEPRFQFGGGFAVSGITLSERNIGGRGSSVELLYIDRRGKDDVGIIYRDPQFAATRWDLFASSVRTAPGWTVDFSLAHPFLGLVGNFAAFQNALYSDRWFRYVVGDSEDVTELVLPIQEKAAQVGAAFRLLSTPRGRSTKAGTYGASVSYEFEDYAAGFFLDSAAAPSIAGQAAADLASLSLRPRETLRVNLLVGVRGLEYQQRRGLNTVRGLEDIAIGATADLALGLALRGLGIDDGHVLAALDLYGGSRVLGEWFSTVRATLEARRDYREHRWRDMLVAVQWTHYWMNNPRNTIELTARFSGGWDMTVPFQLTLGGPWGLAGYAPNRFPGGARASLRLEDRYRAASLGRLFDLGTVLFADVGRMWANDALFGTDSGLRASAGAGFRLATPTGSRTTYRLEFAFPIESRVTWAAVVLSFRIDRAFRLEERPVDVQLGRSRDTAIRAAGLHLQ